MSDRRFRPSPDVTSKVVDGEAILIDLSSGSYYSLRDTGAVVWAMAGAGHAAPEIAEELAARFDADAQRAEPDVDALLDELVEEQLVKPVQNGSPEPVPEGLVDGGVYSPPVLEKYTDLSDLLALDPPMPGIRDIPRHMPGGGPGG